MNSDDPQSSNKPESIEDTKVSPVAVLNQTQLKAPVKEKMPGMPQEPLSAVAPHFPLVPPRPRD